MALRAAQQLYPTLDLSIVVFEEHADAVRKVPWIKNVHAFPRNGVAGPLARGEVNEAQATAAAARWLMPIGEHAWDFVVNWSYNEAGSYICALVPSLVKLGYGRRGDGSISCVDGWSMYLQSVVLGDVPQDIHVTDVLTTQLLTALQIHLGDPAEAGGAAVTSREFFTLEHGRAQKVWKRHDSGQRWIAVQLCEAEAGGWDAAARAEFISSLLKRHANTAVVLLGKAEQRPMARAILEAVDSSHRLRVVSLVGETDFDLWASVIGLCQWMVASDPAAIHLASLLGTRVLQLAHKPEKWAEWGPYGNGHYVVSADAGVQISPQIVRAIWGYAHGEWAHQRETSLVEYLKSEGIKETSKIHPSRSRIRPGEEGGGVVFESLLPRPLGSSQWFARVMGHVARHWYCGWTPPVGQEMGRSGFDQNLVRQLRNLRESVEVLERVLTRASTAAGKLARRSARLRSDRVMGVEDRKEIEALGRELADLDGMIERLGGVQEPLKAFARMSKVLMHNLEGDRIAEIARDSADSYRQLHDGARILSEWLDHSLKLVRPMVVSQKIHEAVPEAGL
jgi:ADP-heptose:LPS heptosyltransferase